MGLLFTVLIGVAAIACFVSPHWGLYAYLASIIIRPNEIYDGVLVPAVPLMIMATSLGFLVNRRRELPLPEGKKSKSSPLLVSMIVLLILHLFVFHREILVDWILSEAAPSILLLLYMTRHVSTMPRLQGAITAIMGSSAYVVLDALYAHFFLKQAPRRSETATGIPYISYGWKWDLYHLAGHRLQGYALGIWGNPNDFGILCNWGILGGLYYLKRPGKKLVKLLSAALISVLSVALFLTGSRGGQLQLGIMLYMMFVGGKRKILGGILLVMALLLVVVVLPRISPERSDAAASRDERTELMMAGVRLFRQYPVQGAGYYNFRELNDFKSLMPHNVYVQCLAETGLIGSAIFFSLIFFLRRETSRAVKYFDGAGSAKEAILAQAIGALQFAFTIFIFFSNQFLRYTFSLVMTQAIALYVTMRRREQEQAAPEDASPLLPARSASPAADPGVQVLELRPEPAPRPRGGRPSKEQPSTRYVYDPDAPEDGVQLEEPTVQGREDLRSTLRGRSAPRPPKPPGQR